ncbi:MAG: hypothetical protein U0359_19470 [Byssovorax sp.]
MPAVESWKVMRTSPLGLTAMCESSPTRCCPSSKGWSPMPVPSSTISEVETLPLDTCT